MIVKVSVQYGAIPQNQEELIKFSEQAWKGMYEEIIEILTTSMPECMTIVIDAEGCSIIRQVECSKILSC